jgi:hypothetical protein
MPVLFALAFVLLAAVVLCRRPHHPEGPVMVYLIAWLIFAALAAACWSVSIACLRGTAGEADAPVRHRPMTALAAIFGVSLASFLPFPLGWVAGLLVGGVAAFAGLGLPAGRASILFCYLAAGSLLTRLPCSVC